MHNIKDYISSFLVLISFFLYAGIKADEHSQKPLTLLTSNFPPLTYQNEQGEFVGSADKIIQKAFAKQQIDFEIKSLPWKRALKTLENNNDHLIYPLSRTREREESYTWVAPIFELRIKTYGLNKNYQKLNLKSGKLSFVCIKTTINCDAVKSLELPDRSISVINNISIEQMMKMVLRGYVDFFMTTETEFKHALNDLGIAPEQFVEITQFQYVVTDYLAGKKDIDPAIVDRVREALSDINPQVK